MDPETKTVDAYKALPVLAMALITGIVLFCLASLVLHYKAGPAERLLRYSERILMIDILLTVILIYAVEIVYARRLNNLKQASQTAGEKLAIYRRIIIFHMALCEMGAFGGIVCFMLFGQFLFFLPVGMLLVEMIRKFPFRNKIDEIVESASY